MELFSFRGRVDRSTNFFTQIVLSACGWVVGTISAPFVEDYPAISIFLLLVMVVGIWIGLASFVKRAHDVGRSGWLAVSPFFVIFAPFIVVDNFRNQAEAPSSMFMFLLGSAVIYFYAVILWVGFKAGDPETNRYGEAPPPPPSAQRANAPVEQPTIDD
jgi:uncharacterized membrane protein YhaH (DUF805 family)